MPCRLFFTPHPLSFVFCSFFSSCLLPFFRLSFFPYEIPLLLFFILARPNATLAAMLMLPVQEYSPSLCPICFLGAERLDHGLLNGLHCSKSGASYSQITFITSCCTLTGVRTSSCANQRVQHLVSLVTLLDNFRSSQPA